MRGESRPSQIPAWVQGLARRDLHSWVLHENSKKFPFYPILHIPIPAEGGGSGATPIIPILHSPSLGVFPAPSQGNNWEHWEYWNNWKLLSGAAHLEKLSCSRLAEPALEFLGGAQNSAGHGIQPSLFPGQLPRDTSCSLSPQITWKTPERFQQ